MRQPAEGGLFPGEVKVNASEDGIRPNEFVRRVIQRAISLDHPLVGTDDPFVVMGSDAFDGHFYPCGSFQSQEEARIRVRELMADEPLYAAHTTYSDGSQGISVNNTFGIFTREGFAVPLEDPEPEQKP